MDVLFPRRGLVPRERDAIPEDYRPRHLDDSTSYGDEPGHLLDGVGINLDRLEHELKPDRLRDIAALVRALTYGEMIRLAQDLWKTRPGGPIDEHSLPMMLHLWSNPEAGGDDGPGAEVAAVEP